MTTTPVAKGNYMRVCISYATMLFVLAILLPSSGALNLERQLDNRHRKRPMILPPLLSDFNVKQPQAQRVNQRSPSALRPKNLMVGEQ